MEKADFDSRAATWDEEPRRWALARDVARGVIDVVAPTKSMDAMDFGCGTGLLTLNLQGHVRSITGVDSSSGMLGVLARKIKTLRLENVRLQLCDVEKGDRPEGAYHLITCSMTLHHVPDLLPLFRIFHDRLVPRGILCLADLDAEDGSFHDNPTGVFHNGLDRNHVRSLLVRAGFGRVRDTTVAFILKPPREYPVFLMCAVRNDPDLP